jgi:hypothetical protein
MFRHQGAIIREFSQQQQRLVGANTLDALTWDTSYAFAGQDHIGSSIDTAVCAPAQDI